MYNDHGIADHWNSLGNFYTLFANFWEGGNLSLE